MVKKEELKNQRFIDFLMGLVYDGQHEENNVYFLEGLEKELFNNCIYIREDAIERTLDLVEDKKIVTVCYYTNPVFVGDSETKTKFYLVKYLRFGGEKYQFPFRAENKLLVKRP